jgi:hypothetical protein
MSKKTQIEKQERRGRSVPVSSINLSSGSSFTASKFSSVFSEHPLIPTYNPSSTKPRISSSVPVNEWTTPPWPFQRDRWAFMIERKSSPAARE